MSFAQVQEYNSTILQYYNSKRVEEYQITRVKKKYTTVQLFTNTRVSVQEYKIAITTVRHEYKNTVVQEYNNKRIQK